jgi:hypothetical protein
MLPTDAGASELATTVGVRMGFSALTPIQRYSMPLAFAGRDLICSAQTGSGKTAAYLIPAIAKMLSTPSSAAAAAAAAADESESESFNTVRGDDDEDVDDKYSGDWEVMDAAPSGSSGRSGAYGSRRVSNDVDSIVDDGGEVGAAVVAAAVAEEEKEEEDEDLPNGGVTPARPRLVVLVPTRELAAQVTVQARRIAFNTGLKVALLHGGQSVKPQLEELAQGPDIVVSTPVGLHKMNLVNPWLAANVCFQPLKLKCLICDLSVPSLCFQIQIVPLRAGPTAHLRQRRALPGPEWRHHAGDRRGRPDARHGFRAAGRDWHFSPPRHNFVVKTHSVDDSRYVPCNQSDTRSEQPNPCSQSTFS